MIGGDQREYGPVSAEELREWVADNRANGHTLVQVAGSNEWKPLATFAELRTALLVLPESVAGAPGAPVASPAGGEARGGELEVGRCLGQGWLLLRRHFVLLAAATTLVWLILTASAFTWLGGLIGVVVAGALHAGLMLLYLRLVRQQPGAISDIFSCFGAGFAPLMLIWIVSHFLSSLGTLCCLVPGLYLKVIWSFSLILAADQGLDFWPAMELSRRVVSRQLFKIATLLAIAYLPVILAALYSGYESTVFFLRLFGDTVPLWNLQSLMDHRVEIAKFAGKLEMQQQLVLLLNLPFAYATLLTAYDTLFPRREA